jgi:hypothetical protein
MEGREGDREEGTRGPSASWLPHKSQELEIHKEKHFKGPHKKESLIR